MKSRLFVPWVILLISCGDEQQPTAHNPDISHLTEVSSQIDQHNITYTLLSAQPEQGIALVVFHPLETLLLETFHQHFVTTENLFSDQQGNNTFIAARMAIYPHHTYSVWAQGAYPDSWKQPSKGLPPPHLIQAILHELKQRRQLPATLLNPIFTADIKALIGAGEAAALAHHKHRVQQMQHPRPIHPPLALTVAPPDYRYHQQIWLFSQPAIAPLPFDHSGTYAILSRAPIYASQSEPVDLHFEPLIAVQMCNYGSCPQAHQMAVYEACLDAPLTSHPTPIGGHCAGRYAFDFLCNDMTAQQINNAYNIDTGSTCRYTRRFFAPRCGVQWHAPLGP